eukprot:COSAG05_NODE_10161_length_580_cov_0.802495_1_plen_122_part_01
MRTTELAERPQLVPEQQELDRPPSDRDGSDVAEEVRLLRQVSELTDERGRLIVELQALKQRMAMEERRRSREQQAHASKFATLQAKVLELTTENSELRANAAQDTAALATAKAEVAQKRDQA